MGQFGFAVGNIRGRFNLENNNLDSFVKPQGSRDYDLESQHRIVPVWPDSAIFQVFGDKISTKGSQYVQWLFGL